VFCVGSGVFCFRAEVFCVWADEVLPWSGGVFDWSEGMAKALGCVESESKERHAEAKPKHLAR
jgi:hypothetical protein